MILAKKETLGTSFSLKASNANIAALQPSTVKQNLWKEPKLFKSIKAYKSTMY